MARSSGPFGPAGARPPVRRHPADDPFAAPSTGQPNGQWPSAPYPNGGHVPQQQGQGYHFPPEPEPNYGYGQPASAPFDNYQNGMQQQPFPPQGQWSQQTDPRGYDLGSYMPAPAQPYPPVDPSQFQQGPNPGAYGTQPHGYAQTETEYEDDEFGDAEEPRQSRRWMFVAAAALVGAIGVGGALAYTYKSLFAVSPGRVPVVKADQNNRGKPSEKMLGRLGEDTAQANAEPQDDRAGDESGGPRRVKTIAINPGGPQAGPPPPSQVATSMPGIMLDNMAPRAGQPPPALPPKAGQQPPRVTLGVPPPGMQPPLAPPPQLVQPQVEAPPPPVARKPPPPPPQQAPVITAKAPPAKPAPSPAPAAAPAAHTGSGYVAVLSSQKSRMDALKVFADLQQRFPDALSGKVPDVQEKDLTERGLGTMYRLVVGPPGSRTAASGICSQLKTAGHEGCWVTEY
jgi:hypothetical protein